MILESWIGMAVLTITVALGDYIPRWLLVVIGYAVAVYVCHAVWT